MYMLKHWNNHTKRLLRLDMMERGEKERAMSVVQRETEINVIISYFH